MNAADIAGNRLGLLARACHPAPTLAVTVLTGVLFISAGNRPLLCLLGVLAVLTGQLSIGWSNDLIDRGRDRAAGRTDKPMVSGDLPVSLVTATCGLAALATVPLSLSLGWPAGLLHLVAVGLGWAYNLGLKSTILSPLPYLFAFATLPVIATLAHHRERPAPWVVLAAGLIGLAAHFANVLPDLAADEQTGVRGLPQRFGFRLSAIVAAALIGLVAVSILLARTRSLTVVNFVLVLVLAGIAIRAKADQAFIIVMLAAAMDVAVIVGSGGLR